MVELTHKDNHVSLTKLNKFDSRAGEIYFALPPSHLIFFVRQDIHARGTFCRLNGKSSFEQECHLNAPDILR